MINRRLSKILLIIATMTWGSSYFLSKIAFDYMDPLTVISQRFVLGFIASAILLRKYLKNIDATTIKQSINLGVSLFLAMVFATYGVKYTTASNAGFLSCLNIIIIPLIYIFVFKQKLSRKMTVSAILCFIGVEMLTVSEDFVIHIGDILCILSAFMFSLVILFGDRYSKTNDPIKLGVLELGVVAILSTILAPFVENYRFATDFKGMFSILFLGVICTAVCYIFQIISQKNVNAVEAGIIMALEPLFSSIFAFLVLGEVLTFKGYLGGLIMLVGVIMGGVL